MDKVSIVKIGGKLIDDADMYNSLLDCFTSLKGNKILVHGGGKRGSQVLEQMGIEVKYHEGRRITDLASMEILTMVYGGGINKQMVADLQKRNCQAIGISGCDLNIIKSQKRPVKGIDYGYAGDIKKVDHHKLHLLLENKISPVLSPITHDKKGQLLNTNADTIAATVASALAGIYQVNLHYCFEIPGVLQDIHDRESVIESISYLQYLGLKHQGIIAKGMIPKLTNAFHALQNGVNSITIGNHIHFAQDVKHTKLKLS